ncbi:hypothetical protein LMG28614_04792 [Paraburkholderia ultramafica]|uniref:Uncharacterized protein n=1 Tax=Paraburkholderia ultramafica TaxID=1544867 RepID=A0A6S7BPR9_9BURK|nr:hypothetical protein LMG28614_04792 [Paraburkholderia ultramafica]
MPSKALTEFVVRELTNHLLIDLANLFGKVLEMGVKAFRS